MRVLAVALALLLALAPLGLAEDDQSSTTSSSADPPCQDKAAREREACQAATERCAAGPSREGCPEPERRAEWCRDANHTQAQDRRCQQAVQDIREEQRRAWVAFDVDPANATLLAYRIGGLLAVTSIDLDLDQGNLSIIPDGSTLRVRAGDDELRLHDEPNGLMRFKGDGNVTLTFPPGAKITQREPGARVLYEGGREGHLLADNATWISNETVQLTGFFAYHVPPAGDIVRAKVDVIREVEVRKQEAIERRGVGAEVTVKAPQQASAALGLLAHDGVQILAYDDVEVEVSLPGARGTDAPLRVLVSADLQEGRTIVLNLDDALLASPNPADLVLRYFDVHDDGSETEVYFFQAEGGLQDVLDATDDQGRPEYWVVQDANGLQVLVSVPHWSAHAITISSVVANLDAPSVLIGISMGAAMTVALGVAMLWPRGREEDED